MKTLADYINESQLIANVVRAELNAGRSVYLVVNNRTGVSMVTSKPSVWGGERNNGIGAIAGGEGGMWNDTYSTPIDQIDSIEQLNRPFEMVSFAIADKTANTGREYIAEDDSNCALEQNARKFETAIAAKDYIIEKGWEDWAVVVEI